jgi:hypothetical protein
MTVAATDIRPYRGRTLNGRTDETGWHPGWSDAAVEAIEAINELTIVREPLPKPVIEDLLGNLKYVGYGLPQALQQLSRSLAAEPGPAGADRDRSAGAAEARDHLAHAARRAAELGALLEAAQSAMRS